MFNQLHPMAGMAMPKPRKALAITVVLPEGDDAGAALHRANVALGDVGLNMVAFYTTTHYDETEQPGIRYVEDAPSGGSGGDFLNP